MCRAVSAQTVLQKLTSTDALERLAALSVDAMMNEPLVGVLSVDDGVQWARRFLSGWLTTASSNAVLTRVVEGVIAELQKERRPLKDVVAKDVRLALRQMSGRPFTADRKLVLTIIDRPPTRELVRQILLDAVLEFGRRASAPVAGMAKGLGAIARFAGEQVKSRSGGLGSLVGAVGDEVERVLERRAVEFVDAALAGVFGQLADAVADPRRAAESAELREALFDGVMELSGAQLARELINADVPGGVEVLRHGLTRWLDAPESQAELARWGTFLHGLAGQRTTKDVLTELGVYDVARALAVEQGVTRMKTVVQGEAFAQWLEGVLA
jgi:hypothetical protein